MRDRFGRWRVAAVLSLVFWVAAARVAAQADPRVQQAEQLFTRAEQEFQERLYAASAANYAEAYRLLSGANHPRAYLVLYNWARALEEGGVLGRSADTYERYLREGGAQADNAALVRARISDLRTRQSLGRQGEGLSDWLTGAVVGYAIAGAGLIGYAITGPLALDRYESLRTECGDAGTCTDEQIEDVQVLAAIADVSLGMAALGAAVGTVLLAIELAGGEDRRAAWTIAPMFAGAGGAGLALRVVH